MTLVDSLTFLSVTHDTVMYGLCLNTHYAAYFIRNFRNNQNYTYAVTDLAPSASRVEYLLARRTAVPLRMARKSSYLMNISKLKSMCYMFQTRLFIKIK